MLGINLLLWTAEPQQAHRPLLESLKNMGYELVEIPAFHGEPEKCAALAPILDELGLARTLLSARGADDNPVSPDPTIRRAAIENGKRSVDCALALGARKVVGPIHSGFGVHSGAGPTQAEWERSVEVTGEVAAYAKRHGVSLSLEFLNRFECYLLNTTADTARFVKDVGAGNVGILFDTHHANIEDEGFEATLARYGGLVNHVHISESHRGSLGTGMVNWPAAFGALKKLGYEGDLVVEAFGTAVQELIPLVKVWRKAYDTEDALARKAFEFVSRNLH
ncbi:sugar phosphate isomerase/epimerase family protein [Aestuariivirga sp.]|uniref:sugar phosphate isomerase/epimerase family protein n=1 Tax=Aestuariivirga sp. TaxID=2650926 RepID=UPI00391C93CA